MTFDDYLAIKNLIHRYPRCADKGDFAGVGKLLGNAIMGHHGGEPSYLGEGSEKFTEIYTNSVRRFPDRQTPRTRHLIGNIIIEDDGPERARAESYVMVFQQTETLPLQAIIGGAYFDRFAKVGGEWQLIERFEDMELIGDISEHVLKDIGGGGTK